MFKCILGERKSGKSVYVEKYIKKMDKHALYVATLPRLTIYEKTIQSHKERRPSSWNCVELFDMSAEEILEYPYQNYQNVILDNLSYYVLFQLYYNKNEFIRKCDGRFVSLIDRIAAESRTTVHFIETPLHQDIFEIENGIADRIFSRILEKSVLIERFYDEEKICTLTIQEAKEYLLNIDSRGRKEE